MSLLLQAVECSDQESDDAMPLFTTDGIVTITGGAQAGDAPNLGIRRVWTDSRTVRRGDLFVALTGVRFDGHQFVADALQKGAVGAIVRRGFVGAGGAWVPVAPSNATGDGPHPARKAPGKALLIEVEDPLCAFQELARAHRRRFGIPVVAVRDRKSTRLNSSHLVISYAVFCLKKKKSSGTSMLTMCVFG